MKTLKEKELFTKRRVIYEKDKNDGLVKSKVVIYKRENDFTPKNSKNVPIWALVVYIMFIVCLFVILIAAITLLFYARRPGLHGEDCIRRSCEKKLGLKCINFTCQCESSKYYLKGCNQKKAVGTFCQNYGQQCKDGLICFNGKCSCRKSFAWNDFRCVQKGSYSDDCSKIECDDSLMLVCDASTKTCDCNSTSRFWSGTLCVLKRGLNEKCFADFECQNEKEMNCINGLCQCNLTYEYYDFSNLKCALKKPQGLTCTIANECLGDMECPNGQCSCLNSSTHYFDQVDLQCKSKTLHNTACSSNITCRADLGLSCVSSKCQCDDFTSFWDGDSCILYKQFNETCTSQSQCSSAQDTICSASRCICNSTTHYFNTTAVKCLPQINEGFVCLQDIECLGDMICSSGLCSCSNSSTHYFSQSSLTCTIKTLNNTSCSSNITCRADLGLSCVSSKCQCDIAIQVWDTNSCSPYKLFNETCSIQSQCKNSQETTCIGSKCACNSTLYYFNVTADKCEKQLNESSACFQDIECLGDMICSSGLCSCSNSSTHYFSQSSLTCTIKTLNNTSCSSNITCRADLGLSCVSSKCQCDTSKMVWNVSECVLKPFCPLSWTLNSGICYYKSGSSITKSFADAQAYCSSEGGSLFTLRNETEWKFFNSTLPDHEYHVGLNLIPPNNSGKWYWLDGTLFCDPSNLSTCDTSKWDGGVVKTDKSCGRYKENSGKRIIIADDCAGEKEFACVKY